ncbi:MAG: response regulator [Anaerolineae bacterium]
MTKWINEALRNLYDSPSLQHHPLARALSAPNDEPATQAQRVRHLLLDAIGALRPEAGVPSNARDRRGYRLLELRYVEGLAPKEVMRQLGIGRSQYFREQGHALEAVTQYVAQHWPLATTPCPTVDQIASEVNHLTSTETLDLVAPDDLLVELQPLMERLAKARQCAVVLATKPAPAIRASRILLRQAVLLAVQAALVYARENVLRVSTICDGALMGFAIETSWPCEAAGDSTAQLKTSSEEADCAQLVHSLGGELRLYQATSAWQMRLLWPSRSAKVLLVVDDNQGMAALFRRYLMGHDWVIVGARDGAEAMQRAAEARPTAIILDVIMPQEDGWQLLARLKENKVTSQIPVIICSILNQPQLATALGAAAYLPKPVSREALLESIKPWGSRGCHSG